MKAIHPTLLKLGLAALTASPAFAIEPPDDNAPPPAVQPAEQPAEQPAKPAAEKPAPEKPAAEAAACSRRFGRSLLHLRDGRLDGRPLARRKTGAFA